MAKPKLNDRRLSTFLTKEVYANLKTTAKKRGFTVSGLLRGLILEYLAKQKEED
jgi:hypothetical protein